MILQDIVERQAIAKGWSCDEKFYVTVKDGTKYLLRITPPDKSGQRELLFGMLKKVERLGIPTCRLVEHGVCDSGVYALYTWIDGHDADEVIPQLTPIQQYSTGLKAGEILKRIHLIPAPKQTEDWHLRFNRKTDIKIFKYKQCGIRFEGDGKVLEYLRCSRDVFKNRPQTFQHGDYHIGNMMISDVGLIIIDFDRFDFGDPWEEFNRIVWCAQSAPVFAAGMVDGYFDLKPPEEFWKCLAFYIGSNTLSSVYWAIDFGRDELDVMLRQAQDVLSWYDGFNAIIPSWYADAQKIRRVIL